jgi:hypothetical protein
VVGFFTGPAGAPLAVTGAARHKAVDRLQALAARWPELLLLTPAALELFRPGSPLGDRCPYRGGDLAFDALLRPRRPCTFGPSADCGACGCPLVALRAAMDAGDAASRAGLERLFPRARGAGAAPAA